MKPTLEVEGLFHGFKLRDEELMVLKDVSFAVGRGEFVSIMGQSGTGKSTLLHIVAGLIPCTSGKVRLGGEDVTRLGETGRARLRRKDLGYVFQNFHLMPHLTAEENVLLPLRIAGDDLQKGRERVRELLERMDVWKRRNHRPNEMSGGELQRVSIARALITGPDLVLADEPTGNLSSQAGEEVMRLLREMAGEEGRAVLLVTHNPYDAARGDRVLFLKDGHVDPAHSLGNGETDASRVLDRLKELGI